MAKNNKIDHIKMAINYREKPDTCSTCANFEFDKIQKTAWGSTYTEEKNLRCALHGFKVKKMAVCDEHTYKVGDFELPETEGK